MCPQCSRLAAPASGMRPSRTTTSRTESCNWETHRIRGGGEVAGWSHRLPDKCTRQCGRQRRRSPKRTSFATCLRLGVCEPSGTFFRWGYSRISVERLARRGRPRPPLPHPLSHRTVPCSLVPPQRRRASTQQRLRGGRCLSDQ